MIFLTRSHFQFLARNITYDSVYIRYSKKFPTKMNRLLLRRSLDARVRIWRAMYASATVFPSGSLIKKKRRWTLTRRQRFARNTPDADSRSRRLGVKVMFHVCISNSHQLPGAINFSSPWTRKRSIDHPEFKTRNNTYARTACQTGRPKATCTILLTYVLLVSFPIRNLCCFL